MSIKQAADYIRSQGRGNDTQLMHVTPSEVNALQGIARAKGGSLTINPNTGLPEAGFLEDILPTVAGTVIGSAVGMPWLGAAVGGGLSYATTGSLEKGLMSGLGAFGGASFLGSLGSVGAAAGAGAGAGAGVGAGTAATAANTSIGAMGAGAGIGGSAVPTVAQLGTQAASMGTAGTGLGAGIGGSTVPTVSQVGSQVAAATPAMSPAEYFASLSVPDKFSAIGWFCTNCWFALFIIA